MPADYCKLRTVAAERFIEPPRSYCYIQCHSSTGDVGYQFGFGQYNSKIDVMNAINDLKQIATSGSLLVQAMQTLIDTVYLTASYRSTTPNLILALVDQQQPAAALISQQQVMRIFS
jgi:hypothetical protein